jgi:hypothetical protein
MDGRLWALALPAGAARATVQAALAAVGKIQAAALQKAGAYLASFLIG